MLEPCFSIWRIDHRPQNIRTSPQPRFETRNRKASIYIYRIWLTIMKLPPPSHLSTHQPPTTAWLVKEKYINYPQVIPPQATSTRSRPHHTKTSARSKFAMPNTEAMRHMRTPSSSKHPEPDHQSFCKPAKPRPRLQPYETISGAIQVLSVWVDFLREAENIIAGKIERHVDICHMRLICLLRVCILCYVFGVAGWRD